MAQFSTTRRDDQTERKHNILMHNDDRTSMEFVIFILMSIFDKDEREAYKVMMNVHNEGMGAAGSYSLATAEAKIAAITELSAKMNFPFRCTIEGKESKEERCGTESEERCGIASNSKEQKEQQLPRGWHMAGSHPADYAVTMDSTVFHSGTKSALVTDAVDSPRGFGTLMQGFAPGEYLEKRLRMKMWLKTDEVKGWVQPWMRVDGPSEIKKRELLSFDNGCENAIKETTDWKEFVMVLDVPKDATNIAFGVMLSGQGKVWMDDVSFEVVAQDVPTTDCPCSGKKSKKTPRNLNFEEG